jgi:hypothetical protein
MEQICLDRKSSLGEETTCRWMERIGNSLRPASFLSDNRLSSTIGASRMMALRATRNRDSNGRVPTPALVQGSEISPKFNFRTQINPFGRRQFASSSLSTEDALCRQSGIGGGGPLGRDRLTSLGQTPRIGRCGRSTHVVRIRHSAFRVKLQAK